MAMFSQYHSQVGISVLHYHVKKVNLAGKMRLLTFNYQLLTLDFRLLTTDFRLETTDIDY